MGHSTIEQLLVSKLLVLVDHLPSNDFIRFMLYLDDTVIELNFTCRSLNTKIKNNKILWQCLYHRQFLNGPHKVKEWDFVYWCARSRFPTNNIPMESAALLNELDWQDLYRRRVTTENNWRYGRSLNTTPLNLKNNYNYSHIYRRLSGTTIMFFPISAMTWSALFSKSQMILIESSAISSAKNQHEDPTVLKIESIPIVLNFTCNELSLPEAMLGDRFFIIVNNAINPTKLQVYTLGDYKLRYTASLPSKLRCKSINGQWLLFMRDNHGMKINSQLVVWDLENNRQSTYDINNKHRTSCIYDTTWDSVIVYAAGIADNDQGIIEWALYQFSQDKPTRQLQQGHIQLNTYLSSLSVSSNEFGSIQISLEFKSTNSWLYHTILLDKNMNIKVDEAKELAQYALDAKNCYNFCYKIYRYLLVEKDDKLDFNKEFSLWAYNDYRHTIGNLFAVSSKENNKPQTLLVDASTGQVIRQIEDANEHILPHFMMTGFVTGKRSFNSQTVSYGAL